MRAEANEDIFIAYGHVMSLVQMWEQAQEIIWWRVKRKRPNRPSGDWDTDRSQREIVRLERALQQTTPQSIIEQIEPSLPDGAADEVRELFADRNRLAHRFLLERQVPGEGYVAGTRAELIEIGNRFMASLDKLMTAEALHGKPYDGEVPPHWEPLAQRITDRAFGGQSIPRDPNQQ